MKKMKKSMKMKKIYIQPLALLLALLMSVSLGACAGNNNAQTNEATTEPTQAPEPTQAAEIQEVEETEQPETEVVFSIGVIQLVEHASLDEARQGFIDRLNELDIAYEEDFKNAQGDNATLKTISQRFVSNKVDLILAIATGSATAIANETSDIPIVGTAITDYVSQSLVESNEKPGGNVTGTTDMNPIDKQIELIKTMVPDVKTVGIMYSSSEANSQIQVDIAKEVLDKMGIAYLESTITSVNDIQQAATSLVGKVEAIFVPTDNNIASAIPTLVSVTDPAKIPTVVGATSMVKDGATATVGLNYYNLGRQSGDMAYRILVEGANPAEMPIEALQEIDFVYNKAAVEAMGITLPQDLIDSAAEVY